MKRTIVGYLLRIRRRAGKQMPWVCAGLTVGLAAQASFSQQASTLSEVMPAAKSALEKRDYTTAYTLIRQSIGSARQRADEDDEKLIRWLLELRRIYDTQGRFSESEALGKEIDLSQQMIESRRMSMRMSRETKALADLDAMISQGQSSLGAQEKALVESAHKALISADLTAMKQSCAAILSSPDACQVAVLNQLESEMRTIGTGCVIRDSPPSPSFRFVYETQTPSPSATKTPKLPGRSITFGEGLTEVNFNSTGRVGGNPISSFSLDASFRQVSDSVLYALEPLHKTQPRQ